MATKTYRIGDVPYYRDGRIFAPGELVTIPAAEKPGRTWTEVKDEPAEPAPVQPADKGGKPKRASDGSPT